MGAFALSAPESSARRSGVAAAILTVNNLPGRAANQEGGISAMPPVHQDFLDRARLAEWVRLNRHRPFTPSAIAEIRQDDNVTLKGGKLTLPKLELRLPDPKLTALDRWPELPRLKFERSKLAFQSEAQAPLPDAASDTPAQKSRWSPGYLVIITVGAAVSLLSLAGGATIVFVGLPETETAPKALTPPPPLPPPPLPPFTPPFPFAPPGSRVIDVPDCITQLLGDAVLLTHNSRCQDGGKDSEDALCELGSDYPDCPVRYEL